MNIVVGFKQFLHLLLETVILETVEFSKIGDHFPGCHAVVDGRVSGDKADLLTNLGRFGRDVTAVDSGRPRRRT